MVCVLGGRVCQINSEKEGGLIDWSLHCDVLTIRTMLKNRLGEALPFCVFLYYTNDHIDEDMMREILTEEYDIDFEYFCSFGPTTSTIVLRDDDDASFLLNKNICHSRYGIIKFQPFCVRKKHCCFIAHNDDMAREKQRRKEEKIIREVEEKRRQIRPQDPPTTVPTSWTELLRNDSEADDDGENEKEENEEYETYTDEDEDVQDEDHEDTSQADSNAEVSCTTSTTESPSSHDQSTSSLDRSHSDEDTATTLRVVCQTLSNEWSHDMNGSVGDHSGNIWLEEFFPQIFALPSEKETQPSRLIFSEGSVDVMASKQRQTIQIRCLTSSLDPSSIQMKILLLVDESNRGRELHFRFYLKHYSNWTDLECSYVSLFSQLVITDDNINRREILIQSNEDFILITI
ncbi:hypothetical protein PROFUN_11755 [Planoprotostelium fungivorum]|uniref:Uncharacterized protein n=1 Tax=Planoprotostelium fungivorum TaxID=1890364 RepID=A0A2P6MYG8_9EUKA|nr:hypothetical protein PROFUN_11755 [Planoprotostelium fungivorum]